MRWLSFLLCDKVCHSRVKSQHKCNTPLHSSHIEKIYNGNPVDTTFGWYGTYHSNIKALLQKTAQCRCFNNTLLALQGSALGAQIWALGHSNNTISIAPRGQKPGQYIFLIWDNAVVIATRLGRKILVWYPRPQPEPGPPRQKNVNQRDETRSIGAIVGETAIPNPRRRLVLHTSRLLARVWSRAMGRVSTLAGICEEKMMETLNLQENLK